MKMAPVELQQALLLAWHTGQREGDLLRLPWSAYDGKTIRLRQGKSRRGQRLGQIIEIPCTAALRRMLDGMEHASPLILSTRTSRSFKKRYFSQVWNRVMRKAGLETVTLPDIAEPVKLHFHDLRGTTVTLLSEAGCTPQQIATITGHSLKTVFQILERYLARTVVLPSKLSSISRTHREQNLQTNCKPQGVVEQMRTKKTLKTSD
jgi:integrase